MNSAPVRTIGWSGQARECQPLKAQETPVLAASGVPVKTLRLLLAISCFLLLGAGPALASHFKGGQITYEDQGGGTYLITFKSYWRSTATGYIIPSYSGPYTELSNLLTTSHSELPDGITTEVVQQQKVKWSAPGVHTISWTSCCRVNGGSNFEKTAFGLFAAIAYNPAQPSSSAQLYDLPLFNFSAGNPLSFSLNARDPEGHALEYTLATPYGEEADLYDRMKATGFSISDKGEISWANPIEGNWLVNAKLAEKINGQYTGAYVLREFILVVKSMVNTAPVFEPIADKMAREEEPLQFEVRATDAEGHSVKLQATGELMGKGGAFTQTAFGKAAAGTFSWTPPAGSSGLYTLQFVATDNANFPLSSQITVQIRVSTCVTRQLALSPLANICVSAAPFALASPFASGTFSGPGVQGNQFSPALAGPGTHLVTCTSTEDNCGSTSTQEITVTPVPLANAGPDQSVIVGYGRYDGAQLVGKAEGVGPFQYKWSTGATEAAITVKPSQTTTYTLTVTDASGCTAADQVTVTVQNVSCGNKNDKVLVCHNGRQICIAPSAVAAHLAHGCYLGTCDDRPSKPNRSQPEPAPLPTAVAPIASFSVHPNPVQNQQATVEFEVTESTAYRVELYDLQGVRVAILGEGVARAGQTIKVPVNVTSLQKGLYLTRLTAGSQVEYQKIMKDK